MSDDPADLTDTPLNAPSISVDQFRTAFPAFADSQDYADGEVEMWLDLTGRLLPADRWGEYHNLGQMLFTAHNLVLNRRDENTANAGGVPGLSTGIMSSKSVGSVSASYDTSVGSMPEAGEWNMTVYGRRMWRLIRMVGMGGTQVGALETLPFETLARAWPGIVRW